MQIPKEQSEKLKRYFINADPFLWGVLGVKNKKKRLKELKEDGFLGSYSDGSNATYSKINQDLLVEPGIEGILERIVIPRVINTFAPDVRHYFQRCWDQGQTPDIEYLKKHRLYKKYIFGEIQLYDRGPYLIQHEHPAELFLQIDRQHEFVERWTVFAGLWFEEIEPLLHSTQESFCEGGNAK